MLYPVENYSTTKNTWETAEHLPEDLIAAFENRSVEPVRANECRERFALLFEKGLKAPPGLQRNDHNATQCAVSDLSWFAVRPPWDSIPPSEEELVTAGLSSSLRKCMTVMGGGCCVNAPVNLKLFLGKSPAFLDEQGRKTSSRPMEKVQIKFMKSYFAGRMQ